MSRLAWLMRLVILAATALGSFSAQAYTGAKWNLPEGVTEISQTVHGLHMMVFWICVAIGVLVFGVMFYSVFAHRRSKGAKPADFHESTTVEILWTAVPFVILIIMAVPAAGALLKMDDTRNADMTVKITGYQWKWEYDYLDQGVKFFSTLDAVSNKARQLHSGIDPYSVDHYLVNVDNPLVLPVGKKIRFLITSNDVIHAWWVSEIAVKKDAIPGYVNEVWTKIDKPGTYRGVCAELCGRDHGFMPIVVIALPEAEYSAWVSEKGGKPSFATAPATEVATAETTSAAPTTPTASDAVAAPAPATEVAAAEPAKQAAAPAELGKDALMAEGEKVFMANCAACHQASGEGMPPTFPSLHGSGVLDGEPAVAINQVLHGKNVMPPFGGQLSDEQVAAVLTYSRSSWGNSASAIQPAQVAALRK